MIAIVLLILQTIAQDLCPEPSGDQNGKKILPLNSYIYKDGEIADKTVTWNYDSIDEYGYCSTSTDQPKNYMVSGVSLLQLEISLDVPDQISLNYSAAGAPLGQFQTQEIKLFAQTEQGMARYQSVYFTIGVAENDFDFWADKPDAEIQVTMRQDQLYSNCDVEPLYAVLSIPIYGITEATDTHNISYAVQLKKETTSNFDFKKSILGAYSSNMASFVSYQAPINVPPCGQARWFVLTQPQFMNTQTLQNLVDKKFNRVQFDDTNLNFVKGKFIYAGDDALQDLDDTVEWAATWVASIIPCVFFALIICVYGQYELSNIGRYKRPEQKHEGEMEVLHQDDNAEKQLA